MIPAWLAEELKDGPIPFERFMELALYHPEHGYYTCGIKSVGRRGDFSTTPTLSDALAEAIASWIWGEIDDLGLTRPYHFFELGPGDGSLMRDVVSFLPWPVRRFCHLHLVEISQPLRELQAKKLRKHSRRTEWHDDLGAGLADLPPDAYPFIFSNEFFDAFPVRILTRDEGKLRELHLMEKDGRLKETWRASTKVPDSAAFGRKWRKGQRLEACERARDYIVDALGMLRQGAMLTIDYGGETREIYHRRPRGTIRGYFLHNALGPDELYDSPGMADLTADVNFEDLRAWTARQGLDTLAYLTQAEFLAPFLDESEAVHQYLADPLGAGEAFKVLIQRKG